jgi:HlyD family secretion protein
MNRHCLSAAFMILAGPLTSCSKSTDTAPNLGYVEAEWTYVSAPDAGWITALPAGEGARVNSGDMLFQLDRQAQLAGVAEAQGRIDQSAAQARNIATGARAADVRVLVARLAEAQARLGQARAERNRIAPLVAQGVESRSRGDKVDADYRTAVAAVDVARANIAAANQAARPEERSAASANTGIAQAAKASAEYRLRQRSVTASFGGRVQETFHRVGEFVTPGTPVLAILEDDALKVRFFVPQARLPQMVLGKRVQIKADGLPQAIAGTISFIASDAEFAPPVIYSKDERAKLVFLVEARIPVGKGLLPGLPVEVRW